MSKFFTSIPVDVKALASVLPAGCYLEKVAWNPETSSVDIHWEHDRLLTPFTYPSEFPAEALKGNKLPEGVKLREKAESPPEKAVVRTEKAVAVGKGVAPKAKPKLRTANRRV